MQLDTVLPFFKSFWKTPQSSRLRTHVASITIMLSFAINLLHLALPIYSLQVFNRVLPSSSLATLLLLTVLLFALTLCSTLLDGARSVILARTALRSDLAVHHEAVAMVLRGDADGQDCLRAADKIRAFRASSLLTALFDAPWSAAFIMALYYLHPWLGHLTVVSVLTLAGVGILGPALGRRNRMDSAAAARDISFEFEVAYAQREVIKAMGLRLKVHSTIQGLHRKLAIAGIRAGEYQSWSDAGARGLRSIAQIGLLSLAALLVVTDDIAVGAIVAASMLFTRAVAPVERLGTNAHVILDVIKAWKQVSAQCHRPPTAMKCLTLPRLTGSLTAERISIVVPGRDRPILGPLSLTVKSGEVLAIVGAQGAGKSTLARLLVGAASPTSGKVRLDGADMLHFDHEELGAQIGFLPEDVQLGAGSIATIIARGRAPDADEVVKAAKLAGAHGAIQGLRDGYQTILQPGQVYLSAGERQQIGLARAIYCRPALVVLDEPTTHLDDSAETDVVRAIKHLKESGSTVIFVSRFAGLLHVTDRFILLDRGLVKLKSDQSTLSALLGPRLATSATDDRRESAYSPLELPHAS